MLTKTQMLSAEKHLTEYLLKHYGKNLDTASAEQLYLALAGVAKETLWNKRLKSYNKNNIDHKTVHYMSIEFLIGRNLRNHLWNLGLDKFYTELLKEHGKDISEVYDIEKDAGLGNGGLGRLAACFMDSLATLGYKAFGHCIKYEYGLFNQKIIDGRQVEKPDEWLSTGDVWLEKRRDQAVDILIGGTLKQTYENDRLGYENINPTVIRAIPYDMMVSGYDTTNTAILRLWEARGINKFNIKKFDGGEYVEALREKDELEALNKVLYPSDNTDKGKKLRLIQEYFLVSAAMQDILTDYFEREKNLKNIAKRISIHINDTHPALCIPELMRLLIDKYGYGWDESWAAVQSIMSYTNHTILSEALEVVNMSTIENIVPRIAMIIRELDRRFRIELNDFIKNDPRRVESMSIISGGRVFMANMSIYASHTVNGVAKIHTHILKTRLFHPYVEIYPDKFKNITNGVTHRRWISQSNPKLDELITSLIGTGYYTKPNELSKLDEFLDDKEVLKKVHDIKFENKKRFADYLKKTQGIEIDPTWRFDVLVKRIHEYKRQLMNVLRIIYLCNKIRENPNEPVTPQVFIFAGKAASGYTMAKRIIKLINQLSVEINNDPLLSSKLKVVFVENYSVTVSELLMPATEVTQQISLAGREASGTGNMKAVANGALMMCTIDGANIEIADQVGVENTFEFGLVAEDVEKIKNRGYNATDYYIASQKVRSVVDKLNSGLGGETFSDIVEYLLGHADYKDSYMCLADFESFIDAHYKMDKAYADQEWWSKKSLHCIASMGHFSSDRSIEEYVQKIWKLEKNKF